MLNGEESGWKMHATLKKGKSVLAFDRIVLAFDRIVLSGANSR